MLQTRQVSRMITDVVKVVAVIKEVKFDTLHFSALFSHELNESRDSKLHREWNKPQDFRDSKCGTSL